ncbi:MAG TPA: hypothetical protein VHV82_01885 [Sporichthyaceae bacterium]|nr:hypothetical protein [Sporichthyaceae bacterium]
MPLARTVAALRKPAGRGGRIGQVLIVLGAIAMVAALGAAVFGAGHQAPAQAAVDKYSNTLKALDPWWTTDLTDVQRTAYCSAWRSNPTSTVATIQSGVATDPAAAARFDPTAVTTYFTSHCST